MADVSKLKINNTSYDIKDNRAVKKKYADSKFVILSDSYGVTSVVPTTWVDVLIDDLGVPSSNVITSRHGGYGFCGASGTKNFIDVVPNDFTNITDGETYDYFIVCCGANDAGMTEADVKTAMDTFFTWVKTKFPNAQIMCGFISWSRNATHRITFRNMYYIYKKCCAELGIRFLKGVEAPMHYYPYLQTDQANVHHPTSEGSTALGHAIFNAFSTGDANYYMEGVATITAIGTHKIVNGELRWRIQNSQLTMWIPELTYGNNEGSESGITPIPRLTFTQIGTISEFATKGSSNIQNYQPRFPGYLTYGNGVYVLPIYLAINENNLYIYNAGTTITSGFGGLIMCGQFSAPIMYC